MRLTSGSFPRLFLVEGEYRAALRRAEAAFVSSLLDELTDGSFEGLAGWQRLHHLRASGVGADLMPMILKEFFPTGPAAGGSPHDTA
jgi:hypothetical protein